MRIPQNIWHPILLSSELKRKLVKIRRFGFEFVLWRDTTGSPNIFSDRCPHMGASLSQGAIVNGKLECPFHAFQFLPSGECSHIPANSSQSINPSGLSCTKFDCIEDHGFIWMWQGAAPSCGRPAYFSKIADEFQTHDIAIDWTVNYSRAVENQLDAAHLPFVHRSTIGRRMKTVVDGPYVTASEIGLDSWVFSRLDSGSAPATQTELRARAEQMLPSLQLQYPGQWLLNISERFKNSIVFVPIDEHHTRFYLRLCHKIRLPIIRQFYEFVVQYFNKIILLQDLRVITHITPTYSPDAQSDRFIGADRAILIYRRWLTRHAVEFELPSQPKHPTEHALTDVKD